MNNYTILLATDDAAVETAVKSMPGASDCELKCVKSSQEAVSMILDGELDHHFAVVDLDLPEGGHGLIRTIGGALPVIAISSKAQPWLTSMVRHRRVGATITKPVSSEKLWNAFRRIRSSMNVDASCGGKPLGRASSQN